MTSWFSVPGLGQHDGSKKATMTDDEAPLQTSHPRGQCWSSNSEPVSRIRQPPFFTLSSVTHFEDYTFTISSICEHDVFVALFYFSANELVSKSRRDAKDVAFSGVLIAFVENVGSF